MHKKGRGEERKLKKSVKIIYKAYLNLLTLQFVTIFQALTFDHVE